jgi:SAM-dependent methyltransferase
MVSTAIPRSASAAGNGDVARAGHGTQVPRVVDSPSVRMNWAETLYIGSRLRTRRLRRNVVPELIELGGGTKGLAVLDVGCGPGECVACELDMFGAKSVTAIDLDPKMVARAQGRLAGYGGRASVGTGDVTDLQFPVGHFDAVFNFAVLHHVPDWQSGLGEIARVLAPGGRFFSQDHDVANHDWLSRQLFRHPPDRFTNAEFLDQLAVAELEVLGVNDQPGQLLVAACKRG